ncbi:DNA-directed RNA polymerases I and III subunit RPAC2 [Tetranychus urticae]|uniref:DNA-directed RNA polymerase I subunit D n=1 Tax=Tetranychus urticae TaxID=32264 RepID=T1JXZ6_TETUR|nr:DNA-directed RNA polymerases I and III subunit RPAC2 [Tetranychus urticae]
MVKLKVLRNEEEGHCVTLEMLDEDHTLGNSLRYIIMKNQCVKFCGYSIPHPTERRVIMQIQTYPSKGVTGLQVFEQGLQDLLSICQVVKHKFSSALSEHSAELES